MIAIDLFAGCGGLSLGLQRAGIEVAAAFENWEPAAACYGLNHEHPVHLVDLSDSATATPVIARYKPDLIAGGPPCQDFSHAGLRKEGDRASLTDAFAEIVVNIRPRWFLMENVDRALGSRAFARARSVFEDTGYGLTIRVLDASRCGVPQRRKRLVCIGRLDGADDLLGGLLDAAIKPTPMTVRQYLGDSLDTEFYYRHPRNYCRRAVYSVDEPAPTMRGVNRPIPKGYPGHVGDAAPIGRKVRPLTTLERARIQTFPKSYRWVGSKTDTEQMIGNAVPVELGRFVGKAILKADSLGDALVQPLDRLFRSTSPGRVLSAAAH